MDIPIFQRKHLRLGESTCLARISHWPAVERGFKPCSVWLLPPCMPLPTESGEKARLSPATPFLAGAFLLGINTL